MQCTQQQPKRRCHFPPQLERLLDARSPSDMTAALEALDDVVADSIVDISSWSVAAIQSLSHALSKQLLHTESCEARVAAVNVLESLASLPGLRAVMASHVEELIACVQHGAAGMEEGEAALCAVAALALCEEGRDRLIQDDGARNIIKCIAGAPPHAQGGDVVVLAAVSVLSGLAIDARWDEAVTGLCVEMVRNVVLRILNHVMTHEEESQGEVLEDDDEDDEHEVERQECMSALCALIRAYPHAHTACISLPRPLHKAFRRGAAREARALAVTLAVAHHDGSHCSSGCADAFKTHDDASLVGSTEHNQSPWGAVAAMLGDTIEAAHTWAQEVWESHPRVYPGAAHTLRLPTAQQLEQHLWRHTGHVPTLAANEVGVLRAAPCAKLPCVAQSDGSCPRCFSSREETAMHACGPRFGSDITAVCTTRQSSTSSSTIVGESRPLGAAHVTAFETKNLVELHVEAACEELAHAVQGGYTITTHKLRSRCPNVARVACALERVFGTGVSANAYLTPPRAQGFECHYDDHCVFAVQVTGSKLWRVYEAEVILPHLRAPRSRPSPQAPPLIEVTLRAGDVLYIPRGFPHEAETSDTTSLHVSFGIELEAPLTLEGALHAAAAVAAARMPSRDMCAVLHCAIGALGDEVSQLRRASMVGCPPLGRRSSTCEKSSGGTAKGIQGGFDSYDSFEVRFAWGVSNVKDLITLDHIKAGARQAAHIAQRLAWLPDPPTQDELEAVGDDALGIEHSLSVAMGALQVVEACEVRAMCDAVMRPVMAARGRVEACHLFRDAMLDRLLREPGGGEPG